MKKEGLFPFQR